MLCQDASSAQIRWETTACCHLFRRSDICLVAESNAKCISSIRCHTPVLLASFTSKSVPVSWNKHKSHANTPSEIFPDCHRETFSSGERAAVLGLRRAVVWQRLNICMRLQLFVIVMV